VESQPQRFLVVFGIIDKSNIGQGVSMMPSRVIIHQHYVKSLNDIALLYMPRDIPFSGTYYLKLIHAHSPARLRALWVYTLHPSHSRGGRMLVAD
jgi:hypothetical protein